MKPVSVTIRWSDGSLTHDIYDGESYYRNPAAMADRPVALHGINRWSSILAFGLKGTFMVGKLFTTLMVQLLPTGATRRNKPRLVESRGTSVCATGIYEQLTPEQRERAKNVYLHPINEVRHEPLARQAQLWGAKEALEKAKFSDVISDGEDIFNAIADQAISQVETLIESTKND